MSNYCVFCDTRRPEGGTNHLVLNGGSVWIEFCEKCGDSHWLENTLTGERFTVGNLFRQGRGEPERPPLVSYEQWAQEPEAPAPEPSNHPTFADIWPGRQV